MRNFKQWLKDIWPVSTKTFQEQRKTLRQTSLDLVKRLSEQTDEQVSTLHGFTKKNTALLEEVLDYAREKEKLFLDYATSEFRKSNEPTCSVGENFNEWKVQKVEVNTTDLTDIHYEYTLSGSLHFSQYIKVREVTKQAIKAAIDEKS